MEITEQKTSGIKSARFTLVAGLSLLLPPLLGFLYGVLFARDQTTSMLYPIPGLVLVPLFFIGPLAIFVPMVLFFVWNIGLFRGDAKTPKRTYGLLLIATLLSPLWFVAGWRDGVAIQGLRYNFSVLGINVVWIMLLWFVFARNWKAEPSFKSNLLVHWFLFAWLAWYAFPFFGEMI